jgi:hypothetical protein
VTDGDVRAHGDLDRCARDNRHDALVRAKLNEMKLHGEREADGSGRKGERTTAFGP